jgi:copper(I)-binding protein
MIMELVAPLEVGSSFNVTLTFASGATTTVEVPVQNEAP